MICRELIQVGRHSGKGIYKATYVDALAHTVINGETFFVHRCIRYGDLIVTEKSTGRRVQGSPTGNPDEIFHWLRKYLNKDKYKGKKLRRYLKTFMPVVESRYTDYVEPGQTSTAMWLMVIKVL